MFQFLKRHIIKAACSLRRGGGHCHFGVVLKREIYACNLKAVKRGGVMLIPIESAPAYLALNETGAPALKHAAAGE
jgi:hypothetical protein